MKYQSMAVEAAKAVRQVVRTSTETANIILAACVTGSNILLYGPPGTGKTLLSSTWGKMFTGGEAATAVIGHSKKKQVASNGQVALFDSFSNEDTGETTADGDKLVAEAGRPTYGLMRFSVGTQAEQVNGNLSLSQLMKGTEKPVFRDHLQAAVFHADEVNRATPPVSSLLMEHLGENRASIGHYQINLPRRMALLTMNPSGSGVFDMDEALTDRMSASVTVEFMSAEDMEETGIGGNWSDEVPVLGTVEDLVAMWDESLTLPWEPQAKTMAAMMIRATTICKMGNKAELIGFPACCGDCEYSNSNACCNEVTPVGVRSHKSLETMAAGYAYLNGDKKVTTKHLTIVAPYVLRHRFQVLTENGSRQSLTRAKEMVKKMMADASQAVDLITQARTGKIRRKDIESVRNGKNQNLLTLENLNRVERLMAESQTAVLNEPLPLMTIKQLKDAIESVPEEHLSKFQAELQRRQKVSGVVEMDSLEDPFFRGDIKTPEGDSLLSDEAWDTLVTTRKVESDLVPGVKFLLKKESCGMVLEMDFGTPEAGELVSKFLEENPIDGFDTERVNAIILE